MARNTECTIDILIDLYYIVSQQIKEGSLQGLQCYYPQMNSLKLNIISVISQPLIDFNIDKIYLRFQCDSPVIKVYHQCLITKPQKQLIIGGPSQQPSHQWPRIGRQVIACHVQIKFDPKTPKDKTHIYNCFTLTKQSRKSKQDLPWWLPQPLQAKAYPSWRQLADHRQPTSAKNIADIYCSSLDDILAKQLCIRLICNSPRFTIR